MTLAEMRVVVRELTPAETRRKMLGITGWVFMRLGYVTIPDAYGYPRELPWSTGAKLVLWWWGSHVTERIRRRWKGGDDDGKASGT